MSYSPQSESKLFIPLLCPIHVSQQKEPSQDRKQFCYLFGQTSCLKGELWGLARPYNIKAM